MKLKVYPNADLARRWFEYEKQSPEVIMSWALRAKIQYVDGTEVLFSYAKDDVDTYKLMGMTFDSIWYAPGIPESVQARLNPLIRNVQCSPSSHSQEA